MTSVDLDKSPTADVDALRAWMRDEFATSSTRGSTKTAGSTRSRTRSGSCLT
jgi:hypothetical protein